MLRVVLDTNVFVSATLFAAGIPSQILARVGAYHLVVSDAILEELRDVLSRNRIRRKYPVTDGDVDRLIADISKVADVVVLDEDIIKHVIADDPPDNYVLATAIQGRADVLVSGNVHLLGLETHHGIRMMTPAAFAGSLRSSAGLDDLALTPS